MAIYHLSVKTLTRSKGQSAIAKAAYNSCACLAQASGETLDYTKKSGLFHAEMIAAPDAPTPERGDFWRIEESLEKRKDSQIAREIEISLPVELTPEQNRALARDMAKTIREKYDFTAVDLCIHYPTKRKKTATSKEQPHVHLMIPTRDSQGKKSKEFQKDHYEETLRGIRVLWEEKANRALAQAGLSARISAASLDAQLQELETRETDIKRQIEETRHAKLFEEERARAAAARTATKAADRTRKANATSQAEAPRGSATGRPTADRAGETRRQDDRRPELAARQNQSIGRRNEQETEKTGRKNIDRDRPDFRPDSAGARPERSPRRSTEPTGYPKQTRPAGDQDEGARAAIRAKAQTIIWRIKYLNQNTGDHHHGKHHHHRNHSTDYTPAGPRI